MNRVVLPRNTLHVSQCKVDSGHAGVHATASSHPHWTVNIEGGSKKVGFLALSLSFEGVSDTTPLSGEK